MKFDVEKYQLEVARRFEEVNNGVFVDFLKANGYVDASGKLNITPDQQRSQEFQAKFVAEVMALDLPDIEDFTEEELRSYFID